ncbi:MAG: YqaJ viral recombinase family nuclease [Ruminiclostridium sp.]
MGWHTYKLRIVSAIDDNDNWVAKQVGHLLEDLVAKIFAVKTGYRIYQIKKMFRHPIHSFMIADVDYFVELPDGTTAILEIKTTNYNAKDKWWDGKKEIVPQNYVLQGRHYMAVMNIDRVYYCCLYGNNENEVIIRQIDRDLIFESELIALEEYFWENHVLAEVPPPYTENGDLVLSSVHRHFGFADPEAPDITLDEGYAASIAQYLELQQSKSELDSQVRMIEAQMKQIKGLIASEMGRSCTASCEIAGIRYFVTFNSVPKPVIEKDNLTRLKAQCPRCMSNTSLYPKAEDSR